MYVIQEVTHHGGYSSRRTISLAEITTDAVDHLVMSAPYSYPNAPTGDMAAELLRTGESQWGWTTWTVRGMDAPAGARKVV